MNTNTSHDQAARTIAATADRHGRLADNASTVPLVRQGFARHRPDRALYLTLSGRALLSEHHPARYQNFSWATDPHPDPAPARITQADVDRYPAYHICGPGRALANSTYCTHQYRLTDSCPRC
ncbi:hypothetical protein HNR23_002311 [Nocardiopsis mwathae]|uniref:Uncharacterized protein n=1 Tax=Nocardiopsis mwathae TaxID=1472723 RepID=A0A7X0D617_9ACTN|nr:hypothetical protein [Nocardiopsis mwathae]MBB6172251.1 hypothetical protein [Nocardiopsis mwathae]